ncbi:Glutamine ABC transport system periplasmic binding component [Klebsiella pneumoniae subsp. pneumoniae KpQ3]|nr:Glutamine ABC transport system periplasmic binding component [Klebsiella pneumoniae subsp. pneumoniae KpQ3]
MRPPVTLSKFHTTLPPSDTAMRPIWLYTELKNAPTLKTYSAAVDWNVPGHYFAETFSRSGMNPSGQSIRGEIMKKSLASMCLSAVLTVAFSYHAVAADLPEIEKSGTLKVATEDDYAPFNFMNNGQADGFNKDMLEELRKYAKFHVDQSILPWTGLLAAVSTGQYDMALTGAVITDERLKVFDFTPPWASAQHYFVKRAGDTSLNTIADLSGKKVGLQAGSALLARLPELKAMLEKTGGKLGPVVEYPSYPEAYADLANKRLDYVINVVISVNDLAKAKPKVFAKGLAVSGPGYMAWPIPKNSPQLLAYMTRFMNHMKETGKLAELQKKWFGETYDNLPTEAITSPEQFHKLAGL